MEFIDVSAKTIEDAIAKGVAQLAAEGQELVETKVLEQPSSGFLGIGRKPAVVRLFFTALAQSATAKEVANAEEQSVAIASEPVATSETEVQDTAVETSESTVTEKPSKKELSKEDQQEIAEKGKQFLDDMFTQMGLKVVIEKMMTKDKITFQVHGEELGILIGKHGQTLDAIQYLTNLVAHKDVSGHCHIVVDVFGIETANHLHSIFAFAHRERQTCFSASLYREQMGFSQHLSACHTCTRNEHIGAFF